MGGIGIVILAVIITVALVFFPKEPLEPEPSEVKVRTILLLYKQIVLQWFYMKIRIYFLLYNYNYMYHGLCIYHLMKL